MDKDLAILIDQNRIIETINQLFIATDNRDWLQVKRCFAPEVLFDMASLGAGEPAKLTSDEIVAIWEAGLKPLKAIHHQAGNHIVRVAEDEAEAFCYAIASHYLPNETGANTRTFVGSYDFGLMRDGEHWRIALFKFNLKFIEGNKDLEGS